MTKEAKSLAVYDRAIAHYPHLATIKDEKTFCRQLCMMAAVPTIMPAEYYRIAAIAEGEVSGENDRYKTPQDRYAAKTIRRFVVNVNRNTDADVLERLEQMDNVQGYIKALIRADIAKCQKDKQ